MNHIVKRGGHTESYDSKKLYASVYAAALSMRTPAGTAELIAGEVVKHVETWIGKKHEVTSNDIRRVAHERLTTINQEAATIYKLHRNIC